MCYLCFAIFLFSGSTTDDRKYLQMYAFVTREAVVFNIGASQLAAISRISSGLHKTKSRKTAEKHTKHCFDSVIEHAKHFKTLIVQFKSTAQHDYGAASCRHPAAATHFFNNVSVSRLGWSTREQYPSRGSAGCGVGHGN